MKKKRMVVMVLVVFVMMIMPAYATTENYTDNIDNNLNQSEENLIELSKNTYVENDRLITVVEYQNPDGMIITDTFERSAIMLRSSSGTDTATRTKQFGSYGKIKVTASFKWQKGKVKCTGMSSSYIPGTNTATIGYMDEEYSENYVSFGKAYAKVDYHLYNYMGMYEKGTLKITCSDSGTISDNF